MKDAENTTVGERKFGKKRTGRQGYEWMEAEELETPIGHIDADPITITSELEGTLVEQTKFQELHQKTIPSFIILHCGRPPNPVACCARVV